jgi:hypothetical protein
MKLKSLIGGVVGLLTVLWLGGCTVLAYMNPMTGERQLNPPSSQDMATAQSNPNSFASKNPSLDFSQKAQYANGFLEPDRFHLTGMPPLLSPTGTPGVSAAGAAATTGPMIGSPPPPPSISPKVY